jgi:superfamily II DNA/RNA helicase
VTDQNYTTPTPIQAAAIPVALRGGDIRASAQTGSGKTAAFMLPILQRLSVSRRESGRFVRALILVPTRELAAQIGEATRRYGRYLPEPIKTLVVYGGVSINPQMMALGGGADIIVATPGRLLDLIDHKAVSLSAVATLVLDEADRLLALGFAEELGRITGLLPVKRQSLFFSATFPPAVGALADALLHEPTQIEIAVEVTTSRRGGDDTGGRFPVSCRHLSPRYSPDVTVSTAASPASALPEPARQCQPVRPAPCYLADWRTAEQQQRCPAGA